MPSHVRHILSGKRLRLLRELLLSSGFSDTSLVDDIIAWGCLTGWVPSSGHMSPHLSPLSITAAAETLTLRFGPPLDIQVTQNWTRNLGVRR